MKNPMMKQTTIEIDKHIHELARRHGINLSSVSRIAITRKVQQAEEEDKVLQKLERKDKKHFAELLPLEDLDGVIPDDCNDVIQ